MYRVCKLTLCVYYPARESFKTLADALCDDHILCAGSADRPNDCIHTDKVPTTRYSSISPEEPTRIEFTGSLCTSSSRLVQRSQNNSAVILKEPCQRHIGAQCRGDIHRRVWVM